MILVFSTRDKENIKNLVLNKIFDQFVIKNVIDSETWTMHAAFYGYNYSYFKTWINFTIFWKGESIEKEKLMSYKLPLLL